jgi:hypothetical protein
MIETPYSYLPDNFWRPGPGSPSFKSFSFQALRNSAHLGLNSSHILVDLCAYSLRFSLHHRPGIPGFGIEKKGLHSISTALHCVGIHLFASRSRSSILAKKLPVDGIASIRGREILYSERPPLDRPRDTKRAQRWKLRATEFSETLYITKRGLWEKNTE